MRDDAARALRVEDDVPRLAELRAVTPDMPLPYEFPRDYNFGRDAFDDFDPEPVRERRFEREPTPAALAVVPAELDQAELDPAPPREVAPAPRPAPGRSYGSHRRGDRAPSGYQPGRRTVAITGQVQPPRRRYQASAAIVARPDRTALWAFLFALFLVVMAIATAQG
jgi:hypothetical protein